MNRLEYSAANMPSLGSNVSFLQAVVTERLPFYTEVTEPPHDYTVAGVVTHAMEGPYTEASPIVNDDILLRVHAAIMTCAWIFFASLGVLLARYYRDMWPLKKVCRAPVWFGLHRLLMPMVVLLTIAGIACVFLFVGGFSQVPTEPYYGIEEFHPVMGMVVLSLGILNPLMAICRPPLESPSRKVFNWAHWCLGTSAHVVAVINILTGVTMTQRRFDLANSYILYVVVSWILFHIFIEVVLQSAKCLYSFKKTKAREREKLVQSEEQEEPGTGCSGFRSFIFGLYTIVTSGVCVYISLCLFSVA